MDFYDRQDQARKTSRRLILLFIVALLVLVAVLNVILVVVVNSLDGETLALRWPDPEWFSANLPRLAVFSLGVIGLIAIASLLRSLSLRSGGATVARALGGVPVDPSTRDPDKRRLYNVVEEMAIATGMPVPDVFVLEQEPGINAFAAGHSPADAAVAVTRGALETLDRAQLQGVIAHEFSHITHGDMRLNLRLVGLLFGILVIALIGRSVLRGMQYSRLRSNDNQSSGIIVVALIAGLALLIVGYIGLFFGRLIQAAVSRQREFLADASAVQFTRDTTGLAGALKKIGGFGEGTRLIATDPEQYGHMLFGSGRNAILGWLSTHPPLVERIRALDPSFSATATEPAAAAPASAISGLAPLSGPSAAAAHGGTDVALSIAEVSQLARQAAEPDAVSLGAAAALRAAIPPVLAAAARTPDRALQILLALLLDRKAAIRARQIGILAEEFDDNDVHGVRWGATLLEDVDPELKLPIAEICLPALRRYPVQRIKGFARVIRRLAEADDAIDAFEFALLKLVDAFCSDLLNGGYRQAPKPRRGEIEEAVTVLFHTLAAHSHANGIGEREAAEAGFNQFFAGSSVAMAAYKPATAGWAARLDRALQTLDGLAFRDKRRLLQAAVVTIEADGRVMVSERELLRAVAAALHVPVVPASDNTN
jgi:Zn-dependent protease with chaperone function